MIELILIIFFIATSGCVMNERGLLPGTVNYKRKQLVMREQHAIEIARLRAVEARMLVTEQKFERLQIEAAKEEA